MKLHDYAGVIHLHSLYSYDGRTPIEAILAAARHSKTDFLLLTDHSTLQARNDGYEGWNNGVLLIVGEEIAPRFNHFLAFGHQQAIDCAEKEPLLPPQEYIDRVNAAGGFGFIAHPDHSGTQLFHVKHYPWQDWSVHGYAGLGIWDFMTDWQNSLTGYLRSIVSYAFPAFFLHGPCPETLARWDRLNKENRAVGIGELDNHDTPERLWRFTFSVFPFSRVMNLIRTHLVIDSPLSGNSSEDIGIVLATLKRGRCYVSLDYFQPAAGFAATLGDDNTETTIGDSFPLRQRAVLKVSLPAAGRIRLIKNGFLLQETVGRELTHTIREEGAYRIEAELKSFGRFRPWIFANPLYAVRNQG